MDLGRHQLGAGEATPADEADVEGLADVERLSTNGLDVDFLAFADLSGEDEEHRARLISQAIVKERLASVRKSEQLPFVVLVVEVLLPKYHAFHLGQQSLSVTQQRLRIRGDRRVEDMLLRLDMIDSLLEDFGLVSRRMEYERVLELDVEDGAVEHILKHAQRACRLALLRNWLVDWALDLTKLVHQSGHVLNRLLISLIIQVLASVRN